MLTLTMTILSTFLLAKMKNSWVMMMVSIFIMSIIMLSSSVMSEYPLAITSFSALDSMSSLLIVLSLWVTSLMIMASLSIKTKKNNDMLFIFMTISLLIVLCLCFSSSNMLLFYSWFEASLIPILLIIVLWGNQPERTSAGFYIIMYTVLASLPLLLMIIKVSQSNYHMNMIMPNMSLPMSFNPMIMWVMLTMAFMVKLPLFSLHLWLPKAHVEAPIAGSMILAGVLLKLGGYGIMRINLMFNKFTKLTSNFMMAVAIIGAVVTNLICLRQTDLKALIAYSSIGHMGLIVVGTLSNSKIGQYGSLMMMVAHGLSSSALFCLANMMYENTKTRNMLMTSGMLSYSPSNTLLWFKAISCNMAIPPTMNLISELFLFMSSLMVSKLMVMMMMLTSLTTASYSLYLYSMINHGNITSISNSKLPIHMNQSMLIMSHLWPLLVFPLFSMKSMIWC